MENIRQVSSVKLPNLMVLCKQYFAYLVQVKNLFQKAFTFFYWQFFDRINFVETNENFFQKLQLSLEVQRAGRKFSDNLGHNILELCNVLVKIRLTTSKTKRGIQCNLVYELPHDLPHDLRLRILGNKEMLGKSQIYVETQPSAQSPFQKLKFGNSSPKTRKSRGQFFLELSSFTGFLYLVPNILSRIVGVWEVSFFVVPEEVVYALFNLLFDLFWNSVYLTYVPQF